MDVESEKKDLLTGLIKYLGEFETGVRQTVSMYQGGNIDPAKKNTIEVIDGLSWIMEGVEVLHGLVEIDITELKSTLVELQTSLENDDDVMTADLFENELLPILSEWRKRMVDVDDTTDS